MIGYDHRFGHNRSEKFEDYVRFGKEIGIEVVQSSPLVIDGINVSSSVVRKTISEGDVAKAAKLLGREYSLAGTVVKGFQVGRTIGFPTANIAYDDSRMLPKDGVYAARVAVDSHLYDAMLYIGSRPTVNTGKISVEAYLFDFSDDIYGKKVNVCFMERIRESIKFNSVEDLKKQLEKDEIKAKQLMANG